VNVHTCTLINDYLTPNFHITAAVSLLNWVSLNNLKRQISYDDDDEEAEALVLFNSYQSYL